MCTFLWRQAEPDLRQPRLDREAQQPAVVVDEEQDRATWVDGDVVDGDDGVGAGKAAVDRRDGPDENAQSLHDGNHGVPVLDCLTMTAGRGTLPEPRPRPGDVGLLGKSR